jgi:hypothetical protein
MSKANSIENRIRQAAFVALCLAISSPAFTPKASADEIDKKTVVTFSEPVEIPGTVLPAGTYVFKILDSRIDRNIVQVFDKDETHLYATVLAIPNYRLKPTGETVIRFEERPTGSPEALRAWFYPGEDCGQEFVYLHNRAAALAKKHNQNVLSMRDEMKKNVSAQAHSGSAASVQSLQETPVTAVNASGEQVSTEQTVSTNKTSAKR